MRADVETLQALVDPDGPPSDAEESSELEEDDQGPSEQAAMARLAARAHTMGLEFRVLPGETPTGGESAEAEPDLATAHGRYLRDRLSGLV